jgi:hypothetical protein
MRIKFWSRSPRGGDRLRSAHKWGGNVGLDFGEVGSGGVDWMRLDRDGDRWQVL